jgi:hypothetical protein
MAANDAAAPSAVGGRADKRSPPPNAQSKRDRKRQALSDKLNGMFDKLQREQDLTYRDQLQKIQLDTNLVQRFDPYDPRALEIIADLQREHDETQGPPVNAENGRSLLDMAGVPFLNFMEEVEDLVEIRDFHLTQSKVRRATTSATQQDKHRLTLTFHLNRMNTTVRFENTRMFTLIRPRRLNGSIGL